MPPEPGAISRRAFLERTGLVAAAMALSQLPALVASRGLVAEAQAIEPDLVRDTFLGCIAFSLPGDDDYSVAQGVTAPGPGGVAAGGVDEMIGTVDFLLAAANLGPSGVAIPLSAALATLLNSFALQVDPAAAGGLFLSPFARLSFAEKAEVFRRLEADAVLTGVIEPMRYVVGLLPAFSAFMAVGEAGAYDAKARGLRGRPVGWQISGYGGPSDGHAGFRGYYRVRRPSAKRTRRRRRRRGRPRRGKS